MFDIKNIVQGRYAEFMHYQKGYLWYRVILDDAYCKEFVFPVPVTDTGDGEFLAHDKAIFFMRWIRKHLEYLKEAKTMLSLCIGVYILGFFSVYIIDNIWFNTNEMDEFGLFCLAITWPFSITVLLFALGILQIHKLGIRVGKLCKKS